MSAKDLKKSKPSLPGKLVIFEGSDGTGKSTQAQRFVEVLRTHGWEALHIREPGSTKLGEEVRKILITPHREGEEDICPEAEMLLYMACRAQLYRTVISRALQDGWWVVLERTYYSTYAYQGWGLGIDPEFILRLGEWVIKEMTPFRVILLDMPVKDSLARLKQGKDRIESRSPEYHELVRKGYLNLAQQQIDLFRIIDGSGSPQEVESRIHAEFSDIL